MSVRITPIEDRLWRYVTPEPNSGCWLWTGAAINAGYGVLNCKNRVKLAHRIAYEIYKGPIPEGLELDHKCRVTYCVNPDHLEPVTHRENMKRGIIGKLSKARAAAVTHCPRGHPYNESNTYNYVRKNGYPSRHCKACNKELKALRK